MEKVIKQITVQDWNEKVTITLTEDNDQFSVDLEGADWNDYTLFNKHCRHMSEESIEEAAYNHFDTMVWTFSRMEA